MIRYCALVAGLLTAGCLSTSGRAGPIAWQAVNGTVEGGAQIAVYRCTLVLRETAGKTIRFATITRTVGGDRVDESVALLLPPHGELRLPFAARLQCASTNCSAQKGGSVAWSVVLIGADEDGKDVRIAFDFLTPLAEDVTPPVQIRKRRQPGSDI